MEVSKDQREQLVRRACEVRSNAYAPHSKFQVGASLLTEDGTFFDGVNVENDSFGLTNCAERTAIFSAITAGHQKFLAVAVATEGGFGPCGACRQVLAQFGTDMIVLQVDSSKPEEVKETTIGKLLPGNFEFPS